MAKPIRLPGIEEQRVPDGLEVQLLVPRCWQDALAEAKPLKSNSNGYCGYPVKALGALGA